MPGTTILTTDAALARAAEAILDRVVSTDGKITKNGILDSLAKSIGGKRQSWGNIKRHDVFAGDGVSINPSTYAKEESSNTSWLMEPAPIPLGSEPVAHIGGHAISHDELYAFQVAHDIYKGLRKFDGEAENALYMAIRSLQGLAPPQHVARIHFYAVMRALTDASDDGIDRISRVLWLWASYRLPCDDVTAEGWVNEILAGLEVKSVSLRFTTSN